MLQKIIVVIMGLVMSVVGALSPDGLLAGTNAGGPSADLAANTSEQTLATLRTSDGQAFARVSVLWVEVDGRRVTEDAWGTGEVDEIRFKVGVKGVDHIAMAVGEKVVELHPTDVITVRMFRGDFSYRGIGTPTATVQLQGTVKSTVLNQGDVGNRVLTQVGDLDLPRQGSAPRDEKVAYVVLTTGEKVDTVAVEDGGSRLFTEEATTAAEAKNEPGNLLAKWVKIDGRLVREYTWGDGALGKVEFEPAESSARSVVLTFNGDETEVAAGERVVIEDFVGEYLAYQVSGGLVRLRLDGYASVYTTASALGLIEQGGEGAPLASFDFAPVSPRTTDTVQFRDRSTDQDGIVVFRSWDFGDNSSGILEDATHRFSKPGTYEVTLTVTDNDLRTSNMTRTIIIRNAEPVPDFNYAPSIVTTDTLVAFNDHSYDSDGSLVNWSWDFGDGSTSYQRHPTHHFTRGGNVTVTLTVTDDLGDRASLSKVILVRNEPPTAGFTYAPSDPGTMDPIQFLDASNDTDGVIESWNWSFGDGRYGAGSSPVHAYARPGLYTVTLTVTDDGGDSDTASTTIFVKNRAPFPEFTWTPQGEPASTPITFTSQSTDPDGVIVMTRWIWGDGTQDSSGSTVTHTFPRAGTYPVTLVVTDNTLEVSNITRTVTIANSAPRADFNPSPNPAFRMMEVTFTDTSTDPDGDPIASWAWDFGDGASDFGRVVKHQFQSVGVFNVTLTVTGADGQANSLTRQLRVLNRPPTIGLAFTPDRPPAAEDVTFMASGVDPDLPGGPVLFEWKFSDGPVGDGPNVTRAFPNRGSYTVHLRGIDSEGGVSAPLVRTINVDHARPKVSFNWTPLVPRPNDVVSFDGEASSANGQIRDWRWDFGDARADSISTRPDPTHIYHKNGTYTVRLTVTDVMEQTATHERILIVNRAPIPDFDWPTGVLPLRTPVELTDESTDPDGQVVNWTWTFGDGHLSYDRHPTHPGFESPGTYSVRLDVTDDSGAVANKTESLNILNTPPVALWRHDTFGLPQTVNNTIRFNGYDESYDPDGTPITGYRWDFGDRSPTVAAANATHVYTHSGDYVVGLTVSDGSGTSAKTADSHRRLRVEPAHSVTLAITGLLPDRTPAVINAPPYAVSVRIGTVYVDGAAFTPVGHGYEVVLDPALWVHGNMATIRVSAPFLSGPNEIAVTLRDGMTHIPVEFQLRMAARPTITPAPGERVSIFGAILGNDSSYEGDPLYQDMTESPRGTGNLRYADGAPAIGMRVDLEARWIPLRVLSGLRNATDHPDTTTALPGWCRMGQSVTDEAGDFDWILNDPSFCVPNAMLEIYPLGRWEVRARPQVPTAENRVSEIRVFYVDPTGGTLLRASFGLA